MLICILPVKGIEFFCVFILTPVTCDTNSINYYEKKCNSKSYFMTNIAKHMPLLRTGGKDTIMLY